MTSRETDINHRAGLHRDVDQILEHIRTAKDDIRSIGYPSSTQPGVGGSGELTSVEAAASHRDRASEWLSEATEAQSLIIRVANMSRRLWPPTATSGAIVAGVSVGQRGSTDENCALCGYPAPSGTNENGQPLVRRIDGQPFHNTAIPGRAGNCYWQVWRQRRPTT